MNGGNDSSGATNELFVTVGNGNGLNELTRYLFINQAVIDNNSGWKTVRGKAVSE